ncbi:MAG TPA: sulfotransferase [Acidimicrobiales bacterium]|nr:sulfotransferase [Acidimicrobiales bacterium]
MSVLHQPQVRTPDFLIIGAQRSASSYLHHCLREHPQLFLPRNEIVYFEDPDYDQRDVAFLSRLFATAGPTQRCGFKRPELLARPECPERIFQELPDARLVAVLREPISRTVSAYFHYMQAGVLPLAPLNIGIRRILRGELDAEFPKAREILDYSRYGEHLLRYYELFPPSSILVLVDEDLRQGAVATLERVYAFLGVQPGFVPSMLTERANAGVYPLPRIRLLRGGSRFIYGYRHGSPYVSLRYNWKTRSAYRAVRWVDRTALAPLYGNPIPELDEDLRVQLTQLFAADLDRLESILDRPLDRWREAAS